MTPEIAAEIAAGFEGEVDVVELVRELVLATYRQDRVERVRIAEQLDALSWEEAALLLAAAKEVALERLRHAIDSEGEERWLVSTAHEVVRAHASWMRLVHGQIVTMLRAGLGRRELAVMVKRSVRCRLDATVVEHLIRSSMDDRDVFAEEIDEVLSEAELLAQRPVFRQEFDGDA